MATLQEMERALLGAHNAGDTQAATTLAQAIKAARGAQDAEQFGPIDPGFGQAALIGTGRQLDRMGKGLKQAGLNVASALGSSGANDALGRMATEEAENSRIYAGLQKIRPGATMLGEAAPLVAAPIAGGGMAATMASAAVPGLMEYGTGEERLSRGALGAGGSALGRVAGNAIARVAKPTQSLTGAQQGAIDAADRLGVKLTSGEASGGRALKWFEAASADMPLAAGVASKRMRGNDAAMARAALRSVGQTGDEVSEAALGTARKTISAEYDRILTPLTIKADKALDAELAAVTGSKVMKSLRDEGVDGLIAEVREVAKSGKMDGGWFQQNKTALDGFIRAAYNNGQPGKAKALEGVEKALDHAAKRSMRPGDAWAYENARRQWANLRMLETGKVVEGGRVLPGRLDSALGSRFRGAYKEGKITGDLADIAKLSGVLRPPPQSGTAPRALYSGLVGGAAFVEPTTAAMMVAAPTALQGLTASNAMRQYLTRGAVNLTPEMERRLLALGARGGLLGAYGASQ